MAEPKSHPEPCRSCTCPNCEPQGTKALDLRRDAWNVANERLTEAVKAWPKGADENGNLTPVTVDAVDVLTLAYWLYTGEVAGS
jgi:hypothetical protein